MGIAVRGEVAPGFEPVRQAFAKNIETGKDVGASFAVFRGIPVLRSVSAPVRGSQEYPCQPAARASQQRRAGSRADLRRRVRARGRPDLELDLPRCGR